jgi:hypothetical protein
MAGLVDTDGSMGIYFTKSNSTYTPKLEFYNDDKGLMQWVVEHFGGTFSPKTDPRRQTVGYRWSPQGKQHLVRTVDTLLPFLIFKRQEALVIQQFLALSGDNPDYRKYLANTCQFLKGKRSAVETETLRNFFKRKPNLMNAYLAGLLDGDGNIDVYETGNPVVIGFTNMCHPFMDAISEVYGGNKYQCKPTTWRWQLSGLKRQEDFLKKIAPYLVFKQEKAHKALDKIRVKLSTPRQFGRPYDEI